MFWYSLVFGIVSLSLICIATKRFDTALKRVTDDYYLRRIAFLPLGLVVIGIFVFVYAMVHGLPYSTGLWEQETIGIILIGAGACFGSLSAVIGWLISRRCNCRKNTEWSACILLFVVAALVAAVPVCIDWLVL